MKITDKLITQLAKDEGFVQTVYKDTLGFDTVGYGTKLPLSENECKLIENIIKKDKKSTENIFKPYDDGYYPNITLNEEMAQVLLRHRLKEKADKLKERLTYQYPNINQENEIICEVLLNMSYQLGVNGLFKFEKMLTALNKAQYFKAYVEMRDSRWYSQTQNRADRLIDTLAGAFTGGRVYEGVGY